MPKGCLSQPLVKLLIKEIELGEFFYLPQNNEFIPHFELGKLLFYQDIKTSGTF
jgi:hypothetical protein